MDGLENLTFPFLVESSDEHPSYYVVVSEFFISFFHLGSNRHLNDVVYKGD